MKVVVTSEHHFERTPDGRVWTDGIHPYAFWTRYLSVFDSVRVVARVRDAAHRPAGQQPLQPAGGPGVDFLGVPDYRGPEEYFLQAGSVASVTARAVQKRDAVILRVPGQMGNCVASHLYKMRRPYAVEVVADPYDVFAPKAVRHPLRPIFRWWLTRRLQRLCREAFAASYVTERALQRRYPPNPQAFVTHCSDVELPPAAFVNAPRTVRPTGAARLISVGSLAQLYKSPDLLIDAVDACRRRGLEVELVLVGGGRYQAELEARALARGLELGRQVHFRGQLTTPEAVRAELDRAHLFVLPSRVEGLPRAMIEAMARALPCIGSTVGGIPELLPGEDLVPPNDVRALANKVREVLADPSRMARMSARNLEKAREYSDAADQRRQLFYRHVKDRTVAWLTGYRAPSGSMPARQAHASSPAGPPAWGDADSADNSHP